MSRLAKNILYNLAGQTILLLVGFIGVKYIFQSLGAEAFGIIQFTATIRVLAYSVLGMGIAATTTREVSAHIQDNPTYVKDVIRTFSSLYWGIFVVLAVAVYFGAPFLATQWLNLETMNPETATQMIQVLGIASLFVFPSSLYSSVLRGLQRMEFDNLIDVGTTVLQQIGSIIILASGGGLFDVVYWYAGVLVLGVLSYIFVSSLLVHVRALIPGLKLDVLRQNLRFALNMASISLLSMVHRSADKVLMSKLVPIGEFGYYSFAFSLIAKVKIGTQPIAMAAFPSFSNLYAKADKAGLLKQYYKVQDLVCFVALPLSAALVFFTLPLFTYLFDARVAQSMLLPIALLALGNYLNSAMLMPYNASLAAGRPEIARRQNLYALFITLPIQALLIYQFGLVGAGLAAVIYNLFLTAVGLPQMCRDAVGITISEWYRHLLKVMTLGVVTFGPAWAMMELTDPSSFVIALGTFALGSVIYIAAAYLFIGVELRRTINRLVSSLRFRLAFAK